MVLIPVLERKANICAKVLEICPSPLTESNLKKKFYKHKILFFKIFLKVSGESGLTSKNTLPELLKPYHVNLVMLEERDLQLYIWQMSVKRIIHVFYSF